MSGYGPFAEVYDRLMYDADYPARFQFLKELFLQYDRAPRLLLDLACGTGGFSTLFAADGTEVIGVDMSEEMLSVARENAARQGVEVLFLCQQAQELDLYGTVDGAICCLDSLNHITDYHDLCRAIRQVALFLEEGRLFIFDVNTVYKHLQVLADNTFVWEEDGVYCVWQNETDPQTLVTDITLDFFVENNGLYTRGSEAFSERAYTEAEIASALKQANLEIVAVLEDMRHSTPRDTAERVIYVTRKEKTT